MATEAKSVTASRPTPLPAERLTRRCDPRIFSFASTAEVRPAEQLIGQERPIRALEFASSIESPGFNLFVQGLPGSGRHKMVRMYLRDKAAEEPTPPDWVYVNNFPVPHKPIAIGLPPGDGTRLKNAMNELIEELRASVPAIFESDEYQARLRAIDDAFQGEQQKAFNALQERASAQNVAVIRTPMGFAMAPTAGGKVLEPDVFNRLEESKRREIQEKIEALQKDLADVLRNIPRLDKERRKKIKDLNTEIAEDAIAQSLGEIDRAFADHPKVMEYLKAVRTDLLDNMEIFAVQPHGDEDRETPSPTRERGQDDRYYRYRVNVLVGRDGPDRGAKGAPYVYEDHPAMSNLVGRVEHLPQMGALITNFNLIKPGVLHQANGGYLVLDARRLLMEPLAWEALKRALRSREIKIESPSDYLSLVSTITLQPDAIPLDVKVVLIGDRELYYLLSALDLDFPNLFKVAADFDDTMDWSENTCAAFPPVVAGICRSENLRDVTPDGVSRLVEHAARLAEDAEKLTLRLAPLADVLREANYWAGKRGSVQIGGEDVARAIAERIDRLDRMREVSQEAITRDLYLIDTSGAAVGQINGLVVISLGSFSFGRPSRITANVRMGAGRVVDIEREVALGGPLHSKGVLILSGYLSERYALDVPMSLGASLVFEQSYGGVDGDSASVAELFALLSAIAQVPLKQSIAVTGSVNQKGRVQPIGGVNEKIEGFFDICRKRGLSGEQGVMIPVSNEKHLMLRDDVVESCRRGEFRIYSVSTIDEGIEILTGLEAGARGENGTYPVGTVNRLVEDRLREFAQARRRFAAPGRLAEGDIP